MPDVLIILGIAGALLTGQKITGRNKECYVETLGKYRLDSPTDGCETRL